MSILQVPQEKDHSVIAKGQKGKETTLLLCSTREACSKLPKGEMSEQRFKSKAFHHTMLLLVLHTEANDIVRGELKMITRQNEVLGKKLKTLGSQ